MNENSLELSFDLTSSSASRILSVTVSGFCLSVASTDDSVGPRMEARFGIWVLIARW